MAEEKKGIEEKRDEKTQTKTPNNLLANFIQIILPAVGIFAALCYFLGRLRTEAYFYTLGINPNALQFTPEDYMFSSFNLVLTFVVTILLFCNYWNLNRQQTRMFLGFPIGKQSQKIEREKIVGMLIGVGIWISLLFNLFSSFDAAINTTPGFIGINAGIVLGIGITMFDWFGRFIISKKKFDFFDLLLLVILFLGVLPFVSVKIAEKEVKLDIEKFPYSIIIFENSIPANLQKSADSTYQSKPVKLITENNNMTYVMDIENKASGKWQIYAFPSSDIKQIIYTQNH